ncbi:hypothetical protein RJT34_14094 [Clitoria ternatea]|uniref:Peptidase A1 domain-containing protein n=1 Tax=Clitoria ternatea TaxID=43366 RepID=A0AAN9JQ26_CLITE
MSNFTFTLLRFLALLLLFNSLHQFSAFQSETPTKRHDHFHIVEFNSLVTASTCNPSTRDASEEELLELVHNYGPCSKSKHHSKAKSPSIGEILERGQTRFNYKQLSANGENNQIGVKWDSSNTFEYVVSVGLGTPENNLTLVMDTGSSLLWTQCQPCTLGNIHGCFNQKDPIFDPSKSSTYTNITCSSPTCSLANATLGITGCSSSTCAYETGYQDGSIVAGFLAKERLSVGSGTFSDIIFGCSEVNVNLTLAGVDGILGLGQDFVSFVEQTSKTYEKVFSYCLPSKASEVGFLKFGKTNQVSKSLMFTQLGADYAIPLAGIKLGNTTLPINLTKDPVVIDSGTVISWLPSNDYITLRDAYRKAMSHYQLSEPFSILDTCYNVGGQSNLVVPKMSFLFEDGLVLDLPPIGVAFPINSTVVCLPFASNEAADGNLVLFGNTQQKTLEIEYDVAGGKIGFGYGVPASLPSLVSTVSCLCLPVSLTQTRCLPRSRLDGLVSCLPLSLGASLSLLAHPSLTRGSPRLKVCLSLSSLTVLGFSGT